MHHSDRALPIVLATTLALASLAQGGPTSESATDATDLDARIARIENGLLAPLQLEGEPVETSTIEEQMRQHGVPAMALAIVDDCEVVWSGSWGDLPASDAPKATGTTPFQAGSVSKAVTATVAMTLLAEGKVDLERPINDLMGSWQVPDNELTQASPVLVRHLLSHSAGLTRTAYGFDRADGIPSIPEILNGNAGRPAIVVVERPGSRAIPSNSGALVLQNLLQDITNTPLPELAKSRVFNPVGMSASAFEPVTEAFLARAATGHDRDGEAIDGKAPLVPAAPGGLWASAEDLGRLVAALMKSWQGRSESLLPRAVARQMLSLQLGDMGLGIHLRGESKAFSFQQAGGGIGSQSRIIGYPERCQGAAIVINSDRGRRLVAETLAAVGQEYDWPDLPLRTAKIQLDAEALERLTGRYEYDALPGNFLTFFVEDAALLAQATRDPFPVYPVSETVVVLPGAASEMRFDIPAAGHAIGVTIGTAGMSGSHLSRVDD